MRHVLARFPSAAIGLAAVCGLGAGLSGQSTLRPEADRVAAQITRQYPFGSSRADWRRRVPEAGWRDHRGEAGNPPESERPGHRGLWCSSATDVSGTVTREAVFYGLRTERPYDCRLEQLRYIFDVTAGDPFDSLVAAFGRTLGRDEMTSVPSPDHPWSAMTADLGAMSETDYRIDEWRDVRYWMGTTQRIYLFRFRNTVQVLAETYILSAALRDRSGSTSDVRYQVDLETWNLVNRLRPRDPEAVDLILSNQHVPDQDLVERVALRLLRAKGTERSVSEKAMLTTAVSLVAQKLRVDGERPEVARPSLRPLLQLGVRMDESGADQGIWYGGYGGRRSPLAGNPDGTFLYRDIITANVAKVNAHQGRVSPGLLLDLAQAYETWWSLSLAPDDEEMVTPSQHVAGAANARLEAIRWYERLIRDFPYSREAERARRVIIQIRVGVDTGQRAFFSPYP